MNALPTLFLLAAGLSVAWCASALSINDKALNQFRQMILCTMPDSSPIFDYTDYGCYCGYGGSGTPVDDLDRCCEVHDQCYSDSMQHDECWPIIDNPYTEFYAYSCDEASKTVTCGKSNNNECEQFICECDRKAAECFARSTWNPEHEHLPSDRC
ncbi:phospholipase A2, minor isoenzyme isoform X1 [Pleuronectes platessa]|uniref:phospholipase A2, minor isoenzyme isoform X1 n=1 Tax=Pleuronectes platessa TaxID=8262 RepID=UPI00232A293D|nr:phospholipase A2, minor isoenzyme isoform X1 [Pleuronectes platessa]